MGLAALRARISDSAIDFALNAFWVAAVSAAATALVMIWAILKDADQRWIYAGLGAFEAFIFVIAVTAGVVLMRRRVAAKIPKVGRKGLLDFQRDGTKAIGLVTAALVVITKHVAEIAPLLDASTQRISRIDARGGPHLLDRRHAEAAATAVKLEKIAQNMELQISSYTNNVDTFIQSNRAWLEWAAKSGRTSGLRPMSPSLRALAQSLEASISKAEAYVVAVENSREISAELDVVGEHIVTIHNAMVAKMKETHAFCLSAVAQLDEN